MLWPNRGAGGTGRLRCAGAAWRARLSANLVPVADDQPARRFLGRRRGSAPQLCARSDQARKAGSGHAAFNLPPVRGRIQSCWPLDRGHGAHHARTGSRRRRCATHLDWYRLDGTGQGDRADVHTGRLAPSVCAPHPRGNKCAGDRRRPNPLAGDGRPRDCRRRRGLHRAGPHAAGRS